MAICTEKRNFPSTGCRPSQDSIFKSPLAWNFILKALICIISDIFKKRIKPPLVPTTQLKEQNVCVCVCVCVCARARVHTHTLSHVQLFATPWTVARQGPLSMEFPRQEYWSGLPFPSPGGIPDPGIKPMSPVSPAWAGGSLPLYHLGSQWVCVLNGFSTPLLSAISLSKEKLGSSCTSYRLEMKGKELEAYLQGLTSEA